jgi:hypothetical protein
VAALAQMDDARSNSSVRSKVNWSPTAWNGCPAETVEAWPSGTLPCQAWTSGSFKSLRATAPSAVGTLTGAHAFMALSNMLGVRRVTRHGLHDADPHRQSATSRLRC